MATSNNTTTESLNRPKSSRILQKAFDASHRWEIGVDEAGRGPLFGRLYVAGVVMPVDNPAIRYDQIKDSKKFHSPKKIREISDHIKEHATAWHIQYITENVIDTINIRQAVLKAMRECCAQCIAQLSNQCPAMVPHRDVFLLVDGNDFVPYTMYDEDSETVVEIPHTTVEGGDNTYIAIAAASILAKVARDEYIDELCDTYPLLDSRYKLRSNKGYGTKDHLAGIREHGMCEWHRRSYGICKTATLESISNDTEK